MMTAQAIMLAIAIATLPVTAYFLTMAGLYARASSHRMKSIGIIRAGGALENAEHERAEMLSHRADRMAFWARGES